MHERRNAILIGAFVLLTLWSLFAWLFAPDYAPRVWPGLTVHRYASLGLALVAAAGLFYVFQVEDRLDDQLAGVTMGTYYEQDGLCFMPLVRVQPERPPKDAPREGGREGATAEISLYYQSRYSGVCEAVLHLRPPAGSFATHQGARDIHFAFRCEPGGFGVIHQPVGVAPEWQGQTVTAELACAVRWPRGKGDRLRSRVGRACGTFDVDWAQAYRQSRHELCGEIDLKAPARLTLTLPQGVRADIRRAQYTQESLSSLEPVT